MKLLKVITVLNLAIAVITRKTLKKVKIPVTIAHVQATFTTDVEEYDIPLLLCRESMKKAKTQIDFLEDKYI